MIICTSSMFQAYFVFYTYAGLTNDCILCLTDMTGPSFTVSTGCLFDDVLDRGFRGSEVHALLQRISNIK